MPDYLSSSELSRLVSLAVSQNRPDPVGMMTYRQKEMLYAWRASIGMTWRVDFKLILSAIGLKKFSCFDLNFEKEVFIGTVFF